MENDIGLIKTPAGQALEKALSRCDQRAISKIARSLMRFGWKMRELDDAGIEPAFRQEIKILIYAEFVRVLKDMPLYDSPKEVISLAMNVAKTMTRLPRGKLTGAMEK